VNLLSHQELDITNRSSVRERIVPPVVVLINAAAYTGVDRAGSEPEIAHRVNAVGTGLLVSRYAALNIPMMHLSTDYVFGGKADSLYVRSVEHVTRHGDYQVWGTYHYCGQPATTWFHFARRIFEAARKLRVAVPRLKPLSSSEYPGRARRPAYSALDCSKIVRTFGIEIPSWAARLPETISALVRARAVK
jgi:dTDP-4-dehydrorhamnose reductase